jgi:hypothetical protein
MSDRTRDNRTADGPADPGPAAPDGLDCTAVITYEQAVTIIDAETIEAALLHDRHYRDDHGRPYWPTAEDLAEALELVEIERSREEVP